MEAEVKLLKRRKNELMFDLRRAERKINLLQQSEEELKDQNTRLNDAIAETGKFVSFEVVRMRYSASDGK